MAPVPADAPTPTEWVAPGPDTLAEAEGVLATRLRRAERTQDAAARWQNALDPRDRACSAAGPPYLVFAEAWRVELQRARTQLQRVDWLLASPSLDAVRTPDRVASIDGQRARVEAAVSAWAVFEAWHGRYGPRCETTELVASSPAGPPAQGERAVWVVGDVLCPQGAIEPGLQLVDAPVCVGACGSCVPRLPAAGEVLLPQGPQGPVLGAGGE